VVCDISVRPATRENRTCSSDASLLAALEDVFFQIGGALAVLAIPLELQLADASDEVFGRDVVDVGGIGSHGVGGTGETGRCICKQTGVRDDCLPIKEEGLGSERGA
jgi:hypothetical protein